ncbi:hypothetical protein [Micromonospora marina]|uniref:hypothetical protein n=1 Tax=Micromonospora marina TaxID=307120 RepID=UPI003D75CAC7
MEHVLADKGLDDCKTIINREERVLGRDRQLPSGSVPVAVAADARPENGVRACRLAEIAVASQNACHG